MSKLKWLIILIQTKQKRFYNLNCLDLNGITLKEKLENLLIRLEGKYASSSLTVANLPTNTKVIAAKPQNMATEAIDKLKGRTQETQNEMHVIWQSLN